MTIINIASITDLESNTAYSFLSLAGNGTSGKRFWETLGHVSTTGTSVVKPLVSSSRKNFRFFPVKSTRMYRVVTRPAKPFVFVHGPVISKKDCHTSAPCLLLPNSSKSYVLNTVEDFNLRLGQRGMLGYKVFCCRGISFDVLRRLSLELNFQYVIYLVNDSDYGQMREDGSWTGIVGDLISGAADLSIGAFSLTTQRLSVIDFTEPFYENEFALATRRDVMSPSIWASLSPFSAQVCYLSVITLNDAYL